MKKLDGSAIALLVSSLSVVACTTNPVSSDDGDDSTGTTPPETTTGIDPDTGTPQTSTTSGGESTDGGSTAADDGTTTSAGTSTGGESDGGSTGIPSVCNNNILEEGEVCDLNQLNGETCQSLGYQGGVLGCQLDCSDYNLLGCFICGNEVIDIAEDCEGGIVPEGVTCESLGYEAGDLACGADCLWDLSECSICGDGVEQGPEDCDGVDLGGETCVSLGFDAGALGCQVATCAYDYSGCEGGQYIQDFEGGAPLPLEFSTMGAADWVVDGGNPINGSFSAWSTDLGEGQNNSLTISATFAVAGDISFMHQEDSEASFDYLQFFIDGVLIDEWSGNNPPAMFTTPVAAGVHDFEWRYDKDGVVSVGADSVWVDDITMIPGVPI